MNLHDLFHGHDYAVAVRIRKPNVTGIGGGWKLLLPTNFAWCADPFVLEYAGKQFLFVERMNRWRRIGTIAVGTISSDGTVSKFKDIIKEPFHLSYPNVFEYDNNVWMIPESGNNRDIRLYKAVDFPYRWQFVKQLYRGANFVDTSFVTYLNDDTAIMNSYDWDAKSSFFFKFDLKKMIFDLLPNNPFMMNERCGGNGFESDGKIFRVLQDCSQQYGSRVLLRKVEGMDFEQGRASDLSYSEILPHDFLLKTNQKLNTCHTYNRSSHVEVADVTLDRFSLLEPLFSIRNKFLSDRDDN